MEICTESYAQLTSTRQSRMKIDALLNPGGDSDTDSPRSQHASVPSSTRSNGYQHPATFPPGRDQYWHNQYPGYHDTSLGAAYSATATTHVSSNNSTNQNQNPHPQHHHHMVLSYRASYSSSSTIYSHSSTHKASHGSSSGGGSGCPGSGSTHLSPDPCHFRSRESYDSFSSSSSTDGGDKRRTPRPKYEEEEMYFIWYHRVDLCQEWKVVREMFNRQFPDRQRRGFQGIQCKFYRFIREKKCPTLREQRRMRDGGFLREGAATASGFGVKEWVDVWFPWMRKGSVQVALQAQISG